MRIALHDADVDLLEEALRALEQVVGLFHEALHEGALHRPGGVDGYDELAHLLGLAVFQRLHERHVAERAQAVGVVHEVELVVVDGHLLVELREAAQEGPVVLLAPVGYAQALHEGAGAVAEGMRARLEVDLDLLGDLLPLLLVLLVGTVFWAVV